MSTAATTALCFPLYARLSLLIELNGELAATDGNSEYHL